MDTFQFRCTQIYLHLSFGLQLVQPTEFLKIIHAGQLCWPSFHIIRWYLASSNMAVLVLNIYIITSMLLCLQIPYCAQLPFPYNRVQTCSQCFCVITQLLDVLHWQLAWYVPLLFKWHNIRFCMKWPMAYFYKYILHYDHISAS